MGFAVNHWFCVDQLASLVLYLFLVAEDDRQSESVRTDAVLSGSLQAIPPSTLFDNQTRRPFTRIDRPGKKENAMLVLTRKIDEQIKIGDDITITVIKLRNNQIRLGIDAPREVRVLRAELEEKETVQASVTEQPSTPGQSVSSAAGRKSEAPRSKSLQPPSAQPKTAQSKSNQPKSAQSRIRNEVIDGLVSADEMIAKALPETVQKDSRLSGLTEDAAPNAQAKPSLQIFSGRVHAKRGEDAGSLRAPLSDYFSAT